MHGAAMLQPSICSRPSHQNDPVCATEPNFRQLRWHTIVQ